MSLTTQVCGIDVSLDMLDCCTLAEGLPRKDWQLPNALNAIEQQFSLAEYEQTLFVVESTGNYSAKVLHVLSKLGRPVAAVNPYQSKSFMSALGHVSKTDKQAAWSLAQMGSYLELRLYKAPSMEQQELKQTMQAVNALEKQAQMLENQLHALAQLPFVEPSSQQALQQVLDTVRAQLEPLKEKLYRPAADPYYQEKMDLATSVMGIGIKTASAILLATNGLEGFDQANKVAKYLGLTPHSHYSGTSIRKRGKITKYGNTDVRALLYNCTRSAIRYNKACGELYKRLRKKGKPHKVAAVAVMHKLVKQVFFCVNSKTMFDNDFEENHKK